MDWTTFTPEDAQRRASALSTLLEQMDVPASRRDAEALSNLKWLNRNLQIQNSEHPMFRTAAEMTLFLLRWHLYLMTAGR
tara:strand:+ start:431 stop:670 length:240 start_codon:yes stop_codon:yes gene_type:complete